MASLLSGLRVIEIGSSVAPAYAGWILAQLGADVIAVEQPGQSGLCQKLSASPYLYEFLLTNKARAALDFDQHSGPGLAQALCRAADLLLIDESNPYLVEWLINRRVFEQTSVEVTVVTPWGLHSPWRGLCDDELLLFSAVGLASVTPENPADPTTERPMQFWGHQAALVGGVTAAVAALQAWLSTQTDGRGRLVDLAVVDAIASVPIPSLGAAFAGVSETGSLPARPRSVLRGIVRCKDGYLSTQGGIDDRPAWARLIGRADWPDSLPEDRVAREDAWAQLEPEIEAWLMQQTAEEAGRLCQEQGIVAYPVNTIGRVTEDVQTLARQVMLPVLDAEGRAMFRAPRSPVRRRSVADEALVLRLAQPGSDTDRLVKLLRSTTPDTRTAARNDGDDTTTSLPLAGVRVADFSWVFAGPHCSQWLGALGAEVLKVESRLRPDRTRSMGPALGGPKSNGPSMTYSLLNYSKLGCSINTSTAEGRRLARRLVDASDVVIENFSTGVAERLGLGYDTLAADHPDLVMVSCSGLGRTGPKAAMRALGKTIHAYAGHTVLTSWPGTPPRGTTSTWTDPLVGVIAALAALAGRVQARRTGAGAYFDLSMAEATIAVLVEPFLEFLNTGHEPQPRGNTVEEWCPHNTYPCADGRWIASAAHTQAEWQALCAAVGMPAALATLAGAAQRNAHRAEIDSVLDRWCHARDANDAVLQLRAHGVCAVLVQSFQEWLESEHVASRDLVGAIVDDDGQRHPVIKLPWVEDPRPPFCYAAPPRIGEHTSQVLTDILGASHAEIAGWTEAGALT